MILADLGADLIKVEGPTGSEGGRPGGPHRGPWVAANRTKRSVALDINLPASRDVALRLAARSDVLLANFRGAKAPALGFDEPTVRARWADNRQR
jgi:CoA:oxalate CoA-transferase